MMMAPQLYASPRFALQLSASLFITPPCFASQLNSTEGRPRGNSTAVFAAWQ